MVLDKKDRLILEALQEDARQSLAALGKRIGLSQPAMSERVRKLEEAGVIEGYGARVNLAALGLGLQAIIRIKSTHATINRYLQLFQSMPGARGVPGDGGGLLHGSVCNCRPDAAGAGGRFARGTWAGDYGAGAFSSGEEDREGSGGDSQELVVQVHTRAVGLIEDPS